jgi:hypothetical protein
VISISPSATARSCALRLTPAAPALTGESVLARLKAAFALDDWTGPNGFPNGSLARTSDDDWEMLLGGFNIRKIPGHNRRRPVKGAPLIGCPDEANKAREWLKEHRAEIPKPKTKTVYMEELIERCHKLTLTRIRSEPSWFARLCAARDTLPALPAFDRNLEAMALEATGWITEVEDDCALERARPIVLCWLRSGQPQRAFAQSKGIHRTELRRLVDSYCDAIADRLNAAPASPAVRLAANDRPTAERKGERLVWRPALSVDQRVYSNAQTIVRGVDAIAAVTGRKPASALRLIEGGKAPIATLAGQPVAIRELLDTSRWRSTAKAQIAA